MDSEYTHLGANLDTRTPEEIAAQDIKAEQVIASAAAVDWQEIAPKDIRTFGIQDQHGKSDCVAESRRKMKRILFNVQKGIDLDFSSVAFYRKRSNYPGQGMIAADAIQLDANAGMTLDKLVPSDVLNTEALANALTPDKYNDDLGKVFAVQNGEIVFTPGDLETIAGTIQKTRKGVMIWIYATVAEWSQEVPTIQTPLTGPSDPRAVVVHSVVGIEPALYKGQKGIWIDDSAHFGGLSRRFITEEFYKARNWWASYPIAFKFEAAVGARPHYTGTIKSAQECYRFEGLFPSNVDFVEHAGPLTIAATKAFQAKYGIQQTGNIGPITTAKLHEVYP